MAYMPEGAILDCTSSWSLAETSRSNYRSWEKSSVQASDSEEEAERWPSDAADGDGVCDGCAEYRHPRGATLSERAPLLAT